MPSVPKDTRQMMSSAYTEHDERFRAWWTALPNDERLRRMKRNSSHHFAVKPQIIIATAGSIIICPSGQTSFNSDVWHTNVLLAEECDKDTDWQRLIFFIQSVFFIYPSEHLAKTPRLLFCLGGWQIVKSSATKNLFRGTEIEASPRSGIDQINNTINVSLRNGTEIKTFREPESKQTVHVFVWSSLPRLMRIRKIHGRMQLFFKLSE